MGNDTNCGESVILLPQHDKKIRKSSEILLNRMYAGNYLSNEANIGHEIINLYRDDNGGNYIYITQAGYIAGEHDGRISAILLVRLIDRSTFEVLAKAENLEQIILRASSKTQEKSHGEQIDYIRANGITYGGVFLDEIFAGNVYKKNADLNSNYITFKAESVCRAKTAIYITEDIAKANEENNVFYLPERHFSSQSLKVYYSKDVFPQSHAVLQKIIETTELWDTPESSTSRVNIEKCEYNEKYTFLTLIRKEYDELSYSNMLAHYLETDSGVFRAFCDIVLDIPDAGDDYSIVREKESNIDLLIRDGTHVIVIENKIKSGINGIDHSVKDESDAVSQLEKYREYILSEYNTNPHCYIFSPDYNKIDVKRFAGGANYTLVFYSKLHNFFSLESAASLKKDRYFLDFLKALKKQSSPVDNWNFEEMQRRFFAAIKSVK